MTSTDETFIHEWNSILSNFVHVLQSFGAILAIIGSEQNVMDSNLIHGWTISSYGSVFRECHPRMKMTMTES